MAPLRVVVAAGCTVQTKISSSSCVQSRSCDWASAVCRIFCLLTGVVSSRVGQALGIICYCLRWIKQKRMRAWIILRFPRPVLSKGCLNYELAADMPGAVGHDCVLCFEDSACLSSLPDRIQVHSRSHEEPTLCASDCVKHPTHA